MFNVELDTYGLKDDDSEEVLDQFYMDQIEYMPIPEIDWEKREENDVYAHTKDVIARTAKWIKLKVVATLDLSEKSSKRKDKKTTKKKTNQSVPNSVVGPIEVEVEAIPEPLQLQVQEATPKSKRVTRSSTKKASIVRNKNTITVDLEVAEDPPMADNIPESQNLSVTAEGQNINLTLVKFPPATKKKLGYS